MSQYKRKIIDFLNAISCIVNANRWLGKKEGRLFIENAERAR